MTPVEWVSAALLLGGGLLSVTAAVGMLRLPDVATRLQAATKPQVLGLLMILAGVAALAGGHAERLGLLLVGLFQLVTAPVLAQTVIRSAYGEGAVRGSTLVVDDLSDDRGAR